MKKTPLKRKTRLSPISKRRAKFRFVPPDVIKKIQVRSGGICEFVDKNGKRCESEAERTPHHVLKRSQGGDHSMSNLKATCWPHNWWAETAEGKREAVEIGWTIPYKGYIHGSLED